MRTIDEYMILPYKMEITPEIDEGGFGVLYSDLPGCLPVGDIIEEGIHREREGKEKCVRNVTLMKIE